MHKHRCHTLDWVVNLFLIFPFVICYWRGIWDLYGYYVFQDQEPFASWFLTGIGSTFVLSYFFYPLFDRYTRWLPDGLRIFAIKVNLYLWGLLTMAYWRGIWELLDYYLEPYGWKCALLCAGVSYLLLLASGTSRTIIFTPFAIDTDARIDVLVPTTTFNARLETNPKRFFIYSMDSLFTHFVVHTLSIVCWRSTLTIVAEISFPNEMDDFWCLVIGLSCSVVLFTMEMPLARLGTWMETRENVQRRENSEKPKNEHLELDFPSSLVSRADGNKLFGDLGGNLSNGGRHRTVNGDPVEKSEENVKGGEVDKAAGRSQRDRRLLRRAYDHLVFLLAFVAEAFPWEGAWNLNAAYLIADLRIGGWANHVLGTFVLFQLGLTSDAGCCGCVTDEPMGDSLYLFSNKFIRLIVEEATLSQKAEEHGKLETNFNQSSKSQSGSDPYSISMDYAIPLDSCDPVLHL